MVKWVTVKTSRPHRQHAHRVSGYEMPLSKPFRILKHKRRPRRTDAQIHASKARKAKKPKKRSRKGGK
jgi:hypothetical protein